MYEIDTPWFDRQWLQDHPDFPLDRRAVGVVLDASEVSA